MEFECMELNRGSLICHLDIYLLFGIYFECYFVEDLYLCNEKEEREKDD